MNEKIDFNKFAEAQKNLRKETAALMEQAVDRAWGDMDEFPRLLNVLETFNRAGDILGGGSANALLIYAQQPGATQLGSFDFWKKQDTSICRGEKGIKVLVRSKSAKGKFFYNVEHRFDVGQTHLSPQPVPVDWADPMDILSAIIKTGAFRAQYDENLPDGADAVYIPELREVHVRDLDGQRMCRALLTEFCHFQQAADLGAGYQRNADTSFVALCGGYVLARRFAVEDGQARFQKEMFPPLTAGNPQERVGMVKNYLSKIIHTAGEVGRELQRGIRELERDCGEIIAPSRQGTGEAAAI